MKRYFFLLCFLFSQMIVSTSAEHLTIAIKDNDYGEVMRHISNVDVAKERAVPPRGLGTINLLELAYYHKASREIMDALMKKGANPNPVLFLVAHTDNITEAQYFYEKGANVDHDNMIFMAVSRGRAIMTKWLLDRGAQVNIPRAGSHVLMFALFEVTVNYANSAKEFKFSPKIEIFKLLLEHGADSSQPVYDGKTIEYYLETVSGISDEEKKLIRDILHSSSPSSSQPV